MRPRLSWFAMVILVACSHDTPDEKLARDVRPATSWVAALQFAAEQWLGNRVPSSFVRESIQSGKKELEKARQAVDESQATAKLRADVSQQLRSAADAADELNGAVSRGDRRAVERARTRFAAAYGRLHDLQKRPQQ